MCVFVDAFIEGKNDFRMLSFLKSVEEEVLLKTDSHIDGAHWHNEACKWLRLRHQVYRTELKNLMERDSSNSTLKTGHRMF